MGKHTFLNKHFQQIRKLEKAVFHIKLGGSKKIGIVLWGKWRGNLNLFEDQSSTGKNLSNRTVIFCNFNKKNIQVFLLDTIFYRYHKLQLNDIVLQNI